MMKNEIKKKKPPTFSKKPTDYHFVPIPSSRRDSFGNESHWVGILTSPDKMRILTLRRTILEFLPVSYFAQNAYNNIVCNICFWAFQQCFEQQRFFLGHQKSGL